MKLRTLHLKNIRSYTDAKVEFPDGLTVFTGDVGSGKSTLLYAVEFALFGATSDLPMEYLLRHGETKGVVELVFEVGKDTYTVHREIEKKGDRYGSIKKGNWIRKGGAMANYTPVEMKEMILRNILKFNESLAPRSASVIYRFAVFTPQEEMKRILEQRIDERLRTLRKAFRVEDYKVAQENAKTIADEIRRERDKLEAKASDLDNKEHRLGGRRKDRLDLEEKLRMLEKRLEKQIKTLEEKKKMKEDLEKLEREKHNLETYQEHTLEAITNLKDELKRARRELKEVEDARAQIAKLEPKEKEYEKVRAELEELQEKKARHDEKARELIVMETDNENLMKRIEEVEAIMGTSPELKGRSKELEKAVSKASKALEKVEENKENLARLQAQLENCKKEWGDRYGERENFKDLEGQAKCPKCGQELSPEHYKKVMDDLETELKTLDKSEKDYKRDMAKGTERVERYTAEARDLEKDKEEMHKIQGELQRLETEGTRLKELKKDATRMEVDLKAARGTLKKMAVNEDNFNKLKKDKEDLEELMKALVMARYKAEKADEKRKATMKYESELSEKEAKLGDIAKELEAMSGKYDDKGLDQARREFETAQDKIQKTHLDAERMRTSMEHLDEAIHELKKEIDVKKEYIEKATENKRTENWLKECFIGSLDVIEKHVMASINEEFQVFFQKWFNMLIESPDINVRIDEEFTPITEQEGYELDHGALSGGERTSVALAFRLALNAMVKRTSAVMKENLLILDEPTDGFSMEQMSKVREVLDELKSDQCIIVTHERELESFADRVFRVVKDAGESRVVDF